ncbi:25287_t:CDS:1, partial [Gigaspora rosea]
DGAPDNEICWNNNLNKHLKTSVISSYKDCCNKIHDHEIIRGHW